MPEQPPQNHDVSNFLYSTQILQKIVDDLKKDDRIMERIMYKHFKKVLDSRVKNKTIKAFRTFEDIKWKPDATIPYEALEKMPYYHLAWLNPHSGQRKLMLGFFEFILKTLDHLKCSDDELLVVYAGASGKASAVIAHLFPQIKIILYDPEANTTDLIPRSFPREKCKVFEQTPSNLTDVCWNDPQQNMYVFTQDAGWFKDDTAKIMRDVIFPLTGRKHLVFVSDIRSEVSEEQIVQDMKAQARWTILMQAKMYMYKFRIPYKEKLYSQYFDMSYLTQDPTLTKRYRQKQVPVDNGENIYYLQGNLHLQLFAPAHSTEMRLIGAPDGKGKYMFTNYGARSIENRLGIFNIVYRSHALLERDGVVGNYDNVFEHLFVLRYLERIGKKQSMENAEDLALTINKMMLGEKKASDIFNPRPFVLKNLAQKLKGKEVPPLLKYVFETEKMKI